MSAAWRAHRLAGSSAVVDRVFPANGRSDGADRSSAVQTPSGHDSAPLVQEDKRFTTQLLERKGIALTRLTENYQAYSPPGRGLLCQRDVHPDEARRRTCAVETAMHPLGYRRGRRARSPHLTAGIGTGPRSRDPDSNNRRLRRGRGRVTARAARVTPGNEKQCDEQRRATTPSRHGPSGPRG